jgi:Tol biopolymer transport system component
VTEGPDREPPVQISKLPRGTQIDTIALSPNGAQILFTILSGDNKSDFRTQMMVVKSDGSEAADYLSDGQSLDIMPSFTPTGDEVVFSSNRAGTRMKIWSMSAIGAPGIMQLTTGETNDLWPVVDSNPKPRLFYQALVDSRAEPRLYSTQRGTTNLTDLNQMGGMQPRVSPRALESRVSVENAVLFTIINDKTGKRDICSMSDKGGVVRNLTNTADIDEYDPMFNKDGSKVVYVSDAGVDEDNRRNYDLWIMDLAQPNRSQRVTVNGSYDDHPVWDLSGNYVYFRSNRGGVWAIWKLAVNQPR